MARRRAQALFDLCAGFTYSQLLFACVRLRLFDILAEAPQPLATLARRLELGPDAARRLLDGAVALRLARRRSFGRYGLGPLGAALVGNAAVTAMIEHHAMLYRDLADPVALLRGQAGPGELARYWAYATPDSERVADYTRLMAASQAMIAAEVLDAYSLRRHRLLLDLGGGDGSFLAAALARTPGLRGIVFDLPAVAERARGRLGSEPRARVEGGDFRRDALPPGADIVSLVRVVHDHNDDDAMDILRAARRALPVGGTLLLAEPMAQTAGARAVGAYFELYLLAMGSGRPRSRDELAAMLQGAGFGRLRHPATSTPLLASVIVAQAV